MQSPLKEIRRSLGLTQRRLAASANVSQSHISDVESGMAMMNSRLVSMLGKIGFNVEELEQKQKEFVSMNQSEMAKFVTTHALSK